MKSNATNSGKDDKQYGLNLNIMERIKSYDRRHGTLVMSNTYKFYYNHIKNGGKIEEIEPLLPFNNEGDEILEDIKLVLIAYTEHNNGNKEK